MEGLIGTLAGAVVYAIQIYGLEPLIRLARHGIGDFRAASAQALIGQNLFFTLMLGPCGGRLR